MQNYIVTNKVTYIKKQAYTLKSKGKFLRNIKELCNKCFLFPKSLEINQDIAKDFLFCFLCFHGLI